MIFSKNVSSFKPLTINERKPSGPLERIELMHEMRDRVRGMKDPDLIAEIRKLSWLQMEEFVALRTQFIYAIKSLNEDTGPELEQNLQEPSGKLRLGLARIRDALGSRESIPRVNSTIKCFLGLLSQVIKLEGR